MCAILFFSILWMTKLILGSNQFILLCKATWSIMIQPPLSTKIRKQQWDKNLQVHMRENLRSLTKEPHLVYGP